MRSKHQGTEADSSFVSLSPALLLSLEGHLFNSNDKKLKNKGK